MVKFWFLSIIFFALSANLANADSAISGAESGFAIDGYDTVAYFTDEQAIIGKQEFIVNYKDAKWLFSTAKNRDLFIAMPERYAPQYGGYCAYAAAVGSLAKGDGKYWRIVDDKLYLNNNWLAQKLWKKDIPGNINKADRHWPSLQQKLSN